MKKKLIGIGAVVLVLALLLTLAPCCGNGDEEATPTPVPGMTPTPGVTPTPTPEAKTLKMGIVLPLSGPGAPWGMQTVQGAEWAADRINTAGGIKVGADTYIIKFVKCDDKYMGSVATTCATQMVYDENIHFVVGSIGTMAAMDTVLTEGKCFAMGIATAHETTVMPERPYRILSLQDYDAWVDAYYKQLAKVEPDIKTVAIADQVTSYDQMGPTREAILRYWPGIDIVQEVEWSAGTVDFYPQLTPIVAKNPDMVCLTNGPVGEQALIVKQIRELGYEGILSGSNHGEPLPGCEIAGNEAYAGFYQNEPVYSSDIYPEATRALYAEFQQRYPGEPCGLCHYLGFATVYFYKQAIETAGSIDPDDVMKVLDDPTWTYEWWGQPGRSLGGLETFGIRRVNQDETVLTSTDENCQKVPISRQLTTVP